MANYESISKIVEELHRVNFGANDGIIKIRDDYDLSKCDIKPREDKPDIKEFMHKEITRYCELCEKHGYNKKDDKFKLCNISHGTHTFDFLKACGQDPEKVIENAEWTDIPVLFLMENPSLDYDIYDYILSEKKDEERLPKAKRPAKKWYWIHSDWSKDYQEKDENGKSKFDTDEYLKQSSYGRMVFALINQYKLANAYMTNAVKCGMSDAEFDNTPKNNVRETKALNLSEYNVECIKKCFDNKLINEINALIGNSKTLIVFAFGKRTYNSFETYLSDTLREEGKNYDLILMPHPAHRISDDFRKYILKGKIEEVLKNNSKSLINKY